MDSMPTGMSIGGRAEALEPLYQWLEEILQEVMDDRTKRSGLQDKADVLKENE